MDRKAPDDRIFEALRWGALLLAIAASTAALILAFEPSVGPVKTSGCTRTECHLR